MTSKAILHVIVMLTSSISETLSFSSNISSATAQRYLIDNVAGAISETRFMIDGAQALIECFYTNAYRGKLAWATEIILVLELDYSERLTLLALEIKTHIQLFNKNGLTL